MTHADRASIQAVLQTAAAGTVTLTCDECAIEHTFPATQAAALAAKKAGWAWKDGVLCRACRGKWLAPPEPAEIA